MAYHFHNLVFEGGGVKGIAYVGALEVLEKEGILQNIKRVAGTSAGAMMAVLVGLRYTAEEVREILWDLNFKKFLDSSFGIVRDTKRLLEEYGWYKGDYFRDKMVEYIKKKTGNGEITFRKLADSHKYMDIYLVGTDLSTGTSVVFNADLYMAAIRRFFGIRQGRLVTKKEVIIETPDYATEQQNIEHLTALCQDYLQTERPQRLPNYLKLFFTVPKTDGILALHNEMEGIIERLSNTRDLHLLDTLGKYPELSTGAHTLFNRQWINMALGIIVPVGLIFWIRVWRFSLRLYRDLKQIIKLNDKTSALITKIINQPETNEAS